MRISAEGIDLAVHIACPMPLSTLPEQKAVHSAGWSARGEERDVSIADRPRAKSGELLRSLGDPATGSLEAAAVQDSGRRQPSHP